MGQAAKDAMRDEKSKAATPRLPRLRLGTPSAKRESAGRRRQRLGEHEGAAQDCEKALQLDPELEWVRPTLEAARKAAEAGACESAEAGQSTRWRVYGNNLFKEGSLREAVSAYRAAVENREEALGAAWVKGASDDSA